MIQVLLITESKLKTRIELWLNLIFKWKEINKVNQGFLVSGISDSKIKRIAIWYNKKKRKLAGIGFDNPKLVLFPNEETRKQLLALEASTESETP